MLPFIIRYNVKEINFVSNNNLNENNLLRVRHNNVSFFFFSEPSNFAHLTPVPASFPVPATAAFSFPKGVEPFYAHHHPGFSAQWAAAAAAANSGVPIHDLGMGTPGDNGEVAERRESPQYPVGLHYGDESQDGLSSSPVEASASDSFGSKYILCLYLYLFYYLKKTKKYEAQQLNGISNPSFRVPLVLGAMG